MDKYQKRIIDLSKVTIDNNDAKIGFTESGLIIEQSENAHIEKYNITIENLAITNISIDGKEVKSVNNVFGFLLDFSSKATLIKLEFADGIVSSLPLNIIYHEKSKTEWDDKEKQKRWDVLLSQAKIKVATGRDLVNIYFQPVADDYGKTVIELYTATGKWSAPSHRMDGVIIKGPVLLSAEKDFLIGKFTVESDNFYKSITGLAYGAYGFKLSQYSSKGELLFTSDYKYFSIQELNISFS